MKIYTKQGDKGKTKLISGKTVWKNSPIIELFGSIDELDAVLALIRSSKLSNSTNQILKKTQINLFEIAAFIGQNGSLNKNFTQKLKKETKVLEKEIDKICAILPKTKHFVMFGDSKKAALINFSRVTCRKTERNLVALKNKNAKSVIPYLNRLSDFLFMLARLCHCEERMQ